MSTAKYFKPGSLEEACTLLEKYEDARVIAGGTDLLVQMKNKTVLPGCLVSIANISALQYVRYDKADGMKIGALTTVEAIRNSSVVRNRYNALARAADVFGSPAIRSQATVGGNICNASPSADIATALMVLGAQLRLVGGDGQTIIPIDKFFIGPCQTVMNHGQILAEILIPPPSPKSSSAYEKQTRRQGADLSVAAVAASALIEDNLFSDVRIALGAVAPTPIRALSTEAVLNRKKFDDRLLEESARAASRESAPIDDVRGFADHRRKLVAALLKRVIRQIVAPARAKAGPSR